MKEIRITFREEDFAAVSRSMIDLGVVFHVEPIEGDHGSVPSGGRTHQPSATRQTKRQTGKAGPKAAGPESAKRDSASGSGAARLRAIVERNQATSGSREPAAGERAREPSQSRPAEIPEDLSEKLITYGDR
jgi:hypothetical protein